MDLLFPAFFDHPPRIRFAQQEEDEHIELFLRQHWITNVPWIATAILLLLVPTLIPFLLTLFAPLNITALPDNLLLAVTILWYLLVLAYIIESFLYWYFNIYIVTNQNLVDINFRNLLSRDVVEVSLKDVQSQRPSIVGIIASLFNYGDVIVETAAEKQKIEFLKVPLPDLVSDRIQDLTRALERSDEAGEGGLPG